jgi:hypothetical protein
MTLSILMYALMISSLAAAVGMLVVDAVGGTRPQPAPRRIAAPVSRYGRERLRERPEARRPHASTTARARRGATPQSCRR